MFLGHVSYSEEHHGKTLKEIVTKILLIPFKTVSRILYLICEMSYLISNFAQICYSPKYELDTLYIYIYITYIHYIYIHIYNCFYQMYREAFILQTVLKYVLKSYVIHELG